MKKTAVLLTIITAFLGIFIFSCEEEEIEEHSVITNKFQFTETKVDSVSYNYVILSYQAENPDKLTIKKMGLVWNTEGEPDKEDTSKVIQVKKKDSIRIENLLPGTQYYYRFYIEFEENIKYFEENTFKTVKITIPELKTKNLANITANSAESGGIIIDKNGGIISACGVCWNKSGSPTLKDSLTSDKLQGSEYFSELKKLEYNVNYYVRAYAKNEAGTSYGEELTFVTKEGIPTLTTNSVTNITPNTAESGGEVNYTGVLSVMKRGVCWNKSGNPDISDDKTVDGTGTGNFTSLMTGLSLNTTYYVRAYATTDAGTGYGNEQTFTIGGKPTVTTSSISNIDGSSAEGGGNVTDDGGFAVTEKGLCWSTSSNPTTSDNTTNDGSGTGSFTSSISGLSPSTTYYVRAYATNDAGTSYGGEKTLTTTDGLAELTTNEITDITGSSATSGGNITDNGGFDITTRGVCWSTSSNPTTSDNTTNDGSGTGSFTSELTGLTEGTTYYVRAYATNSVGTAYGEERGTFTDSRDGQTYNWVRIGDQVWMAENLNYDQSSYGNDWCYDNNSSNCDTYGRLYDWAAVMQGTSNSNSSGVQGVCPDGWHVPSDEEWKELEMHLGMSQSEADNTLWRGTNEGSKMAGNASLWTYGDLENNSEFGSSGFTALPGGYRSNGGYFNGVVSSGSWWSSSEYSSTAAWRRELGYSGSDVYRYYCVKEGGFSVRCVRDD